MTVRLSLSNRYSCHRKPKQLSNSNSCTESRDYQQTSKQKYKQEEKEELMLWFEQPSDCDLITAANTVWSSSLHIYNIYIGVNLMGGGHPPGCSVEKTSTIKPAISGHSIRKFWDSLRKMLVYSRWNLMQNTPKWAFCLTFDLHLFSHYQ